MSEATSGKKVKHVLSIIRKLEPFLSNLKE